MLNLADIFSVFKSVEFLERYGTDEEKRNAVKEIQSKALSSFYLKYGLVILACLFVVLVKYLKLRNSLY